MSRFLISTPCECQASLSATLDEHRHVTAGWATRSPAAGRPPVADKELAPAHSINAHLDRFDVAWLAPTAGQHAPHLRCGRHEAAACGERIAHGRASVPPGTTSSP